MAEVELNCAVYGEGTVFPVAIAGDAKVSVLQEAIFDKKRYKERYSFDASELTLYLARKKEGKWLKDDDSLDAALRGGVDRQCKKLRSSWTLDDDEYFGEELQPGRKEIHVLVEFPEAAGGSEGSVTAQMVKKIDEMHEQVVTTKRKRCVHSEMSSNKGNALLQDLNIRVKPVGTVPFTARDPAWSQY